jgi:hypothetical protein
MQACYHEADMRHIGINTAMMQIDRRRLDVNAAIASLVDGYTRINQGLAEGRAAIAREQQRGAPSVAHGYWYADAVDRYVRDFNVAKSLTFLSVQAAEYELQQSFGSRGDVVSARHPDQLRAAHQVLMNFLNARNINGNRPAGRDIVLSLRDDILGLTLNHTTGAKYGPNERNVRLRERLTAPEAAVYDANGSYLGQGIAFTFAPPPDTETRCAERLWTVSATLSGFGLGTKSPTGELLVMKRHTAFSKWCHDHGDGSPYQVTTVRPRGQLYGLVPTQPSDDHQGSYATALLQPFFNKTRKDFFGSGMSSDVKPQGASDELSGRALYGDYVLVFPYATMLNDPSVFNLDSLEDVLIRFDYYSVNDVVVP